MRRKYFTKEEQEALKSTHYVKSVSEKSIAYTEEFKEDFYPEYVSEKKFIRG